ncbi:tRNA pseudouridine(54/55) synthase, variant 1 [Aphanomyces invadans]|uniref:tRNA pseudouridine(55) synthase n=1 Tax=Aphanomyces invadans TaxID=157072 RepID=A0A024UIC9_9STRA|nr:tRNA pseudouridine(54/55) synthase, variant 1 [Aphanomyces invadans]ETW05363.1 tRNA pseudouridine(54/55) synthase, variant 1 [Aphanomyces invadans]|eukprot:XP_008866803.1 tRNA pseudouridine(54/55) synthase, variant 1 [Aphanomyces invadans]
MAANATLLGLLPAGSFEKLHALKSLGVCVRCILRYAAVTDHELYSLDSAELSATWDTFSAAQGQPVPDAPAAIAGVCTCCLDVFEGALGASNRADLVAKAKDCGYATTTFMIAIQIPSATLIRQHSLSHHVKFPSTPIDLKEVLKWCLTPILATALNNATYVATSDVSIHLHFQHELSEQEAMQVPTIRDTIMQNKRRKLEIDAFGAVTRALQSMHDFPSTMPCPPTVAKTPCSLTVKMERAPTYVAGRYLKYQRGLSQTPWVLDGERLGESSVEEAIGDIVLPHFHAKSYKFHTAGREDVDVRMLGNGRPFILELIDAKVAALPSPAHYERIQAEVNETNADRVEIRGFQLTDKKRFSVLQAGADSKRKTYCCVVWVAEKLTPDRVATLNSISDLAVAQKTPGTFLCAHRVNGRAIVRVLHRRTLLTRPKVIHSANVTVLNDHYMLLRLTTSAGTYVKEFVHGDLGRTLPNVSTLLVRRRARRMPWLTNVL